MEIHLDNLYVSIIQVNNTYFNQTYHLCFTMYVKYFIVSLFRTRKYWWLGVLELLLPLQQHLWRRHPDTDKGVQGFYRRRSRVSWGTIRN